MQGVLHSTGEQVECRHTNGEISNFRTNTAVMGMKRVRIASISPEMSDGVIRTVCLDAENCRTFRRKRGLVYTATPWPMAFDSQ
jgi:hypothetical protein